MIKSNEGKVEIIGEFDEVMADLSLITLSLLRGKINKNDICKSIQLAFEKYDKKYKVEE